MAQKKFKKSLHSLGTGSALVQRFIDFAWHGQSGVGLDVALCEPESHLSIEFSWHLTTNWLCCLLVHIIETSSYFDSGVYAVRQRATSKPKVSFGKRQNYLNNVLGLTSPVCSDPAHKFLPK